MWIEERYRRTRDLLRSLGHVTVERITSELGVSRETVRRDLVELEALGEIRRVHGGAILAEHEAPIDVRAATRIKEKRAIAKAATACLEKGQTVFLDAGTTTSMLAESLCSLGGLYVVTNSVAVATRLGAPLGGPGTANQVHLIGGNFNSTIGATYGPSAISEIHRFHADVALLSPVGVDADHGATSFVSEEAELARAMSKNARCTIILADHSKIGVRSRVAYCSPDEISLLITSRKALHLPSAERINKVFRKVDYV